MIDDHIRQLQRRARQGDPDAERALILAQNRTVPPRDPRRDPQAGDVVEVPSVRFCTGGVHRRLVLLPIDDDEGMVRTAWQVESRDTNARARRFGRSTVTTELLHELNEPKPDGKRIPWFGTSGGALFKGLGVSWLEASGRITLGSWRGWARHGRVLVRSACACRAAVVGGDHEAECLSAYLARP